jgi:hypothetical protein
MSHFSLFGVTSAISETCYPSENPHHLYLHRSVCLWFLQKSKIIFSLLFQSICLPILLRLFFIFSHCCTCLDIPRWCSIFHPPQKKIYSSQHIQIGDSWSVFCDLQNIVKPSNIALWHWSASHASLDHRVLSLMLATPPRSYLIDFKELSEHQFST